ncbi:unnamed protein product [Boreogadus saida]
MHHAGSSSEESGGGPVPGLGRAPLLHGPHQAFNNTPARSRTTLLIGLSGSRCGEGPLLEEAILEGVLILEQDA